MEMTERLIQSGGGLPLKDLVAADIRSRIAGGRFKLGEQLSDKLIAEELSISRTPVREALLALAADGLVSMVPHRGTFVFLPSARDITDICAARSVYETGALRLLSPEQAIQLAAQLLAITADIATALGRADLETCEDLDTAFHETMIAGCGNNYVIGGYAVISGKVRALRRRLPDSVVRVRRALKQHEAIAQAVGRGQLEAAARQVARHVIAVEHMLSEGAVPLS